jgi:hypothetical protein
MDSLWSSVSGERDRAVRVFTDGAHPLVLSCPLGISDLPNDAALQTTLKTTTARIRPYQYRSNSTIIDTGDILIGLDGITEYCRKITNQPRLHKVTVWRWLNKNAIPSGRLGSKTVIASKAAIAAALTALARPDGTQSPK